MVYGAKFNRLPIPKEARRLFPTFRVIETEHFGRPVKVWAHLAGVCECEGELLPLLQHTSANGRGVHSLQKGRWIAVYAF